MFGHTYNNVYLCSVKTLNRKMKRYRYIKSNGKGIVEVFNAIDTEDAVYITAPDPIEHPMNLTFEDPATGSGNSAFANYLLSENLWDGSPITIEQGGNDHIFNSVKLKYTNGQVLFGGKATVIIEGDYII